MKSLSLKEFSNFVSLITKISEFVLKFLDLTCVNIYTYVSNCLCLDYLMFLLVFENVKEVHRTGVL